MPNSMMPWAVAGGLFILGILLGLGFAPSTDEIEEQLATLQAQVEQQSGAAAGQDDAVAAQSEKIAGLEAQVADLAVQLEEWADSLDANSDRLSAVEAAGDAPGMDELKQVVAGTEAQLAGLADQQQALAAKVESMGQAAAAPATAAAEPASSGSAAAAETAAAATPARPAGLDAPGVHELGVGASVWLIEGQVSLTLSRVDADGVRVFVGDRSVMVARDQTVTLRGLPAATGACSVALKHIEGRKAFLALSCS